MFYFQISLTTGQMYWVFLLLVVTMQAGAEEDSQEERAECLMWSYLENQTMPLQVMINSVLSNECFWITNCIKSSKTANLFLFPDGIDS